MLTKKFFIIVFSIILLIISGTFIRNEMFLIATIPIFYYLILGFILSKKPSINIKISREKNSVIIQEDSSFIVKTYVENLSKKEIENLIIVDKIDERIKVSEGVNVSIFNLKPLEKKEIKYTVTFTDLGRYKIGPLNVFSSNIQGYYFDQKDFKNFLELRVSPSVVLIDRLNLRAKYVKFWPGENVSKRIGIGNEFYGISEVSEGESLRRINWKASAKLGKLMKNVYHSELGNESLVVLDLREIEKIKINEYSLTSYIVKVGLLISYRLIRDKQRVGLLIIGDKLYKVHPSFGKKQFDRILYTILEADTGKVTDIRILREYMLKAFPITTQIFFITSSTDYDTIYLIAELAIRGFQLIAIFLSPLPILNSLNEKYLSLIKSLIKLERETLIKNLSRYALIVDWNLEKPINVELKRTIDLWNKSIRKIY